MRYIRLTLNKEPAATSECISFLEGIYQSIAETLPEIRDCSISTSLVDSTALLETEDSYRKGVTLKEKNVTQVINKKFVKRKGPRKFKSGMQVNRDRSETREIRYLPPGRMKDYYEMMLSQYSSETAAPASFSTFYRAPGPELKPRNLDFPFHLGLLIIWGWGPPTIPQNFLSFFSLLTCEAWIKEFPHLVFRTKRQHLECSVCQRHRLLLRSFSHNLLARREQTVHYHRHIRAQYLDRIQYWSIRQDSRQHSKQCLAVILDGMDQAKFAYPRCPVMGGKQWANLARPRCHIVGIKVHGYGMFFGISRASCSKDSNHHTELLATVLTMVQKRYDLNFRRMHLHVQSDNCVRETKNNTVARWLSSNISRGDWGNSPNVL